MQIIRNNNRPSIVTLLIISLSFFVIITGVHGAGPLRINGHGVINELTPINVSAHVNQKGKVGGHINSPGGLSGPVVELIAPNEINDYWCVNFEEQDLEGYNVLVYILDSGDGQSSYDELAFGEGFGENCIDSPTPLTAFSPLTNGDYKTN